MTVKLEVLGTEAVIKKLKITDKKIMTKVSEVMVNVAQFMEGEVKQSVAGRRAETRSVDTGRFLNSVEGRAQGLAAQISSDVEYAKILEFGGTTRVGRRHFRNSLTRNKPKIQKFVDEAVKDAV